MSEDLWYPCWPSVHRSSVRSCNRCHIRSVCSLSVPELHQLCRRCSVVEEFLTGRGTLQQIGFSTPNQSVLGAILLVFGGATLVGTVSTLTKATGGKLSLKCACGEPR